MRGDWARTCGRADSGLLFEAAGLADDEPDEGETLTQEKDRGRER